MRHKHTEVALNWTILMQRVPTLSALALSNAITPAVRHALRTNTIAARVAQTAFQHTAKIIAIGDLMMRHKHTTEVALNWTILMQRVPTDSQRSRSPMPSHLQLGMHCEQTPSKQVYR